MSALAESHLIKIQSTLLDIGSHIATPRSSAAEKQLSRVAKFDTGLTKVWIFISFFAQTDQLDLTFVI